MTIEADLNIAEIPYESGAIRFRYPSFKPSASWSVIQEGRKFFIQRVVWDQVQTVDSEPVTYGAESPIEEEGFRELLSELRTPTPRVA